MAEHFFKNTDDALRRKLKRKTDAPPEKTANKPLNVNTADVVSLQRVMGNQGVQRMLSQARSATPGTFIQTKLEVGAANDPAELEADEIASQVMSMSDSDVQEQREDGSMALARDIQRQEMPEEEEEMMQAKRDDLQRQEIPEEEEELMMKRDDLQRQEMPEEEEELMMKRDIRRDAVDMMGAFEVGGSVEDQINQTKGSGQALPDETRTFMENRFGQDFSDVTVHADSTSDSLNRSLSARAFTQGNDIYMRSDQYRPHDSDGQQLLAHELTHVVQQTGGKALTKRDEQA